MAKDQKKNEYESDSDQPVKPVLLGFNAIMLMLLVIGGAVCGGFIGAAVPIIGPMVGMGLGVVFGLSLSVGELGIGRFLLKKDLIAGLGLPLLSVTAIGAGVGLILGTMVFPGLGSALGASIGASIGFGVALFSELAVVMGVLCFKKDSGGPDAVADKSFVEVEQVSGHNIDVDIPYTLDQLKKALKNTFQKFSKENSSLAVGNSDTVISEFLTQKELTDDDDLTPDMLAMYKEGFEKALVEKYKSSPLVDTNDDIEIDLSNVRNEI